MSWWDTATDIGEGLWAGAEHVPVIGETMSAVSTGYHMGASAYYGVTGDRANADRQREAAQSEMWNVLPGVHEVRDIYNTVSGDDPLQDTVHGSRDDHEYGHVTVHRDQSGHAEGISGGAGLANLHGERGGVDILHADGGLGRHRDADGREVFGVTADVHTVAAETEGGAVLSDRRADGSRHDVDFDAQGPRAGARAIIHSGGAELGVDATLLGAAGTSRQRGTTHDQSARGGLSEGEGAALRLNWGDDDGDGARDWGIGADVGPMTVDLRAEDPLGLPGRVADRARRDVHDLYDWITD